MYKFIHIMKIWGVKTGLWTINVIIFLLHESDTHANYKRGEKNNKRVSERIAVTTETGPRFWDKAQITHAFKDMMIKGMLLSWYESWRHGIRIAAIGRSNSILVLRAELCFSQIHRIEAFFIQLQSRVWLFSTPWTIAHQLPHPSPSSRACSRRLDLL